MIPSYTGKITAVTEDKRLAHHHMQVSNQSEDSVDNSDQSEESVDNPDQSEESIDYLTNHVAGSGSRDNISEC